MPLGKYYCDYCDKQFQDTPSARRRHLQGVVHQRAKALWFGSGSRPSVHRQRSMQSVCPNESTASCDGIITKDSFPGLTEDDYSILESMISNFLGSCQYGDSCKYYHPKKNVPSTNTQGMEAGLFGNQMGASLGNLPPSLWPPPEGGYPPLPFIDWG